MARRLIGNKRKTLLQAHFHLEVWISVPREVRSGLNWVKMNLDTGAAGNTFPLNFGPDGAGDGRFYRTASGEWIPDSGAWQFQGYDGNILLRSLNGRLTDVMRTQLEKLMNWHGKNELIPVFFENNIFDFVPEPRSEIHRDQQCEQCSAVGKRVWQSSALVSPTKTLNRDVAPNGDDIEPIGESRADVEMGNHER